MTDEQEGAADPSPTEERAPKKPRRHDLPGSTLGGVLVGFDYQVFRASKPPAELVEKAKPVRGISGEGGSMLSIAFPDDLASEAKPTGDPPSSDEPSG